MNVFVIIKPDAIMRGLVGRIISRFENKELYITRIEIRHKNAAWCREHYAHLSDEIYVKLGYFMTSNSLIGIIFNGERALEIARQLVGITDSVRAVPGTIRGDYGSTPILRNIIHVSDSLEATKREIELFFNDETDKS